MDSDRSERHLPTGRGDAQKLPSIVGAAHAEAGPHLFPFGYLPLDDKLAVGKGRRKLSESLFEAFAARFVDREPA